MTTAENFILRILVAPLYYSNWLLFKDGGSILYCRHQTLDEFIRIGIEDYRVYISIGSVVMWILLILGFRYLFLLI